MNRNKLIGISLILVIGVFLTIGCINGEKKYPEKPTEVVEAWIEEVDQGNIKGALKYISEEEKKKHNKYYYWTVQPEKTKRYEEAFKQINIEASEIKQVGNLTVGDGPTIVNVEAKAIAPPGISSVGQTSRFRLVKNEEGKWKIVDEGTGLFTGGLIPDVKEYKEER